MVGQVVLAVAAAGLCHGDLHMQDGTLVLAPPPFTLGHEIAGWVIKHGPGVDAPALGTLVVNVYGSDPPFPTGLTVDGGLAEQVVVPASALVQVPEGVTAAQAAVSTDAVATAYHAVKVAGEVRLAQKVGIIGLGGLGLNGLQTAVMCGAHVVAVNRRPSKDETAIALGAQAVYRDVSELPQQELDVVIDFVGLDSTIHGALKSLRVGGRVVLVGLEATTISLPTIDTTYRNLTVRGSWAATRESRIEVLNFIAQGKLVPVIEEITLDEVIDGYQRLHDGKVVGRLAACMPAPSQLQHAGEGAPDDGVLHRRGHV
jgi:propanol-preferring alcohol dehydrogenase